MERYIEIKKTQITTVGVKCTEDSHIYLNFTNWSILYDYGVTVLIVKNRKYTLFNFLSIKININLSFKFL